MAQPAYAGPDAPPLTDGVVLLDRFTDADVDALWAGEDNGHVRRTCLPGPFTRHDIADRISRWQSQWQAAGPRVGVPRVAFAGLAFAVREAAARRLVGGCVLEIRAADRRIAELSYWVFPPYRCRGYATRAVELVCHDAFERLGIERLELSIEPSNGASLRVAAKAGFRMDRDPCPCDRCHAGRGTMVLLARRRTPG